MQQRTLGRALILSRQPSADVDEPSARYVRRGKGVRVGGHGVVGLRVVRVVVEVTVAVRAMGMALTLALTPTALALTRRHVRIKVRARGSVRVRLRVGVPGRG